MNSKTKGIDVLAATAWVGGPATLPHRIVLCRRNCTSQPFAVWTEVDYAEGRTRSNPESNLGFDQGDYCDTLEAAWERFDKRARRILTVGQPGYEATNVISGRTI